VELTKVVVNAIGNDRTAIRLTPWRRYQDMLMSDPIPQFSDVVRRLADFELAYLHACESDMKDDGIDWLLKAYGDASPVLLAGNYNGESAKETVDNKYPNHDIAIECGRLYIANPDLPFRVKKGSLFAPFHSQTVYGQGSEGYTD
jgi:NADPH2 dehydrogenase